MDVKQLKDKDGNDITDANAVHKTGDETVGGQKTFTSSTKWKLDSIAIRHSANARVVTLSKNDTRLVSGSVPSENIYSEIVRWGNDTTIIGTLMLVQNVDGKSQLVVQLKNSVTLSDKTIVLAESD